VGGITPRSVARRSLRHEDAAGGRGFDQVIAGDRPVLAERAGVHEWARVRDDDGRSPDGDQIGPRIGDPSCQRAVGLAARPVELEIAASEHSRDIRRDRR
jgi:hypothetical protein